MKLRVSTDNRSGSVSAKAGKPDAREDNYNVDPSKRYAKIARTLSERAGSGAGEIVSTVETSSEYVGFQKETYECASLTFKSNATIKLPTDSASVALGVVHDSISMGFRVERPCKVHLTATALSDMDVAEVRLEGPSFDKPLRIFDDFDDTLDLTKPGEHYLRGAYQLSVRTPNPSLGGRPLAVEMRATLTPVP
jgi:hypothetical protein